MKRVPRRWLLLCGLLPLIAGCASSSARPVSSYSGPPLAKPSRVIVTDFVVSADQIAVNRGPRAIDGLATPGAAVSAEQLKVGQDVAATLSDELVKRIRALGLASQRVPGGQLADPDTLVIEGRFVTIDEGSRIKRLIIGFGAGGSVVKTMADVYIGGASGPVLVQSFETDATSARTPGLIAGGPAVAAGRVVVGGAVAAAKGASETKQGVAAHAERTAEELAKRLAELFVARGWIPPSAVK